MERRIDLTAAIEKQLKEEVLINSSYDHEEDGCIRCLLAKEVQTNQHVLNFIKSGVEAANQHNNNVYFYMLCQVMFMSGMAYAETQQLEKLNTGGPTC